MLEISLQVHVCGGIMGAAAQATRPHPRCEVLVRRCPHNGLGLVLRLEVDVEIRSRRQRSWESPLMHQRVLPRLLLYCLIDIRITVIRYETRFVVACGD